MGHPLLEFAVLIVLLVINGLFSASELALMSAKKSRLDAEAERGHRGARAALRLADRPGAFLATVQIGITLIGTISAVFAGGSLTPLLTPLLVPIVGSYAGAAASVLVVLLVTFLSLILGELAPKSIALRSPERLSMRVAPFMAALARFARPVVGLLDAATRGVLWLLGLRGEPREHVTEEDVRALVEQAAAGGSLEPGESERIERVLRFNDRRVRDLMTPRPDVHVLDVTQPIERVVSHVLRYGHEQFPVRGDGHDVRGTLSVTDVLRALHESRSPQDFVRPAVFVPESAWADDALTLLQRHGGAHLAVVVDEYGDFTGLITVGDLLAELAGDGGLASGELTRLKDGSVVVAAGTAMHDLRGVLPLPELGEEDFTTLAGYVLARLGSFPTPGTRLVIDGWTLEVAQVEGARLARVLVRPPEDFVWRETPPPLRGTSP